LNLIISVQQGQEDGVLCFSTTNVLELATVLFPALIAFVLYVKLFASELQQASNKMFN